MKEKIKTLTQSIINSVKPKLEVLIPNPKLRKVLYYGVGGLFGFMFLLILLGLLISPLKKNNNFDSYQPNKTKVEKSSPAPKGELSETERKIIDLENKINEFKFPESILTIPSIKDNLTI